MNRYEGDVTQNITGMETRVDDSASSLFEREAGATLYEPSDHEKKAQRSDSGLTFSKVGQRWTIERDVGQGGVGKVVEAYDQVMSRRSAIKTLRPDIAQDNLMTQHFIREARLTGILEHPNIVPVHDLCTDDEGTLFFIMKLVTGNELVSLIYDKTSTDEHERLLNLLDVFLKVCDALAFAHSRDVLHCDIKAENVMIGDFGEVFLMDWGVAMIMDEGNKVDETSAGVIGTPMFMSPEQARGVRRGLTPQSDIYSMGAMLYEVLARTLPFNHSNPYAIIEAVRKGRIVAPSVSNPDVWIPKQLEKIVLKAMSLNPEDRYGTIKEMQRDIQRFIRNETDFPRVFIDAGEEIVKQGEEGDKAFAILSGSCEVRYTNEAGSQKVVRTLSKGEIFGETAILAESLRTASVYAVERTELVVISRGVVEGEVESLKPWMANLMTTLANRFKRVTEEFREHLKIDKSEVALEVLMFLKLWGEEKEGALRGPWALVRDRLVKRFTTTEKRVLEILEAFPTICLDEPLGLITINDPADLSERLRERLEVTSSPL